MVKVLLVFSGDYNRNRSEGNDCCRFGASVLQTGSSTRLATKFCGFPCWWWQVCDNYFLYSYIHDMDKLHIKALLAVCAHVSVMIDEPET